MVEFPALLLLHKRKSFIKKKEKKTTTTKQKRRTEVAFGDVGGGDCTKRNSDEHR